MLSDDPFILMSTGQFSYKDQMIGSNLNEGTVFLGFLDGMVGGSNISLQDQYNFLMYEAIFNAATQKYSIPDETRMKIIQEYAPSDL